MVSVDTPTSAITPSAKSEHRGSAKLKEIIKPPLRSNFKRIRNKVTRNKKTSMTEKKREWLP